MVDKREKGIPPNYSNAYLDEAIEADAAPIGKREKGIPPNYSNAYLDEATEEKVE